MAATTVRSPVGSRARRLGPINRHSEYDALSAKMSDGTATKQDRAEVESLSMGLDFASEWSADVTVAPTATVSGPYPEKGAEELTRLFRMAPNAIA